MVAFAPVGLERVVQGFAVAGLLLVLLRGLAAPCVAEVVGVGVDAQEPDQAVQLAHPILQVLHCSAADVFTTESTLQGLI